MWPKFEKYEGAGNDFVMVDDRDLRFPADNFALVKRICDRHFGVGADGLILVRQHEAENFEMVYYNADGRPGSMCGNGGRAAILWAVHHGMMEEQGSLLAADGVHSARFEDELTISLGMRYVSGIEKLEEGVFIHTGSPHVVLKAEKLREMDVVAEGRKVRYSERWRAQGTNVNFIEETSEGILIRTYERGVEDETLACGTGITAAALAIAHDKGIRKGTIALQALGGKVEVLFEQEGEGYKNIVLRGPARKVFEGVWNEW